ncbi:hypothetical protein EYF80_040205 [Liparis tanakae]|uniref:Uncharacterized protein n=1 Tax=Liparis tanakae TaxID=230148 RepID=A0A4Z2G7P1_9TELE|nr:hypothetical protein EYF80_040205 [Liparis tanakae]
MMVSVCGRSGLALCVARAGAFRTPAELSEHLKKSDSRGQKSIQITIGTVTSRRSEKKKKDDESRAGSGAFEPGSHPTETGFQSGGRSAPPRAPY